MEADLFSALNSVFCFLFFFCFLILQDEIDFMAFLGNSINHISRISLFGEQIKFFTANEHD
jgi:hypothetical protein